VEVRHGHGTYVRRTAADRVEFGDGRSIRWDVEVPGGRQVEVRRRRPGEDVVMELSYAELDELRVALGWTLRRIGHGPAQARNAKDGPPRG
jgi:hypothetical protein